MISNRILIGLAICLMGNGHLAAQQQANIPLDAKSAFVALLASYSKTEKENSNTLLENVVYSEVANFSLNAAGGYFVKDEMALGLGFDYISQSEDAENVNAFGPNTFVDRHLDEFRLTPFMRNYFSISAKNNFYLFTQIGLEFGFGNGTQSDTTGDSTTLSDIDNRSYGIAFAPGVIWLVQKGFAFEVNIGVLGLRHSKESVTPQNEDATVIKNTDFNLNINLLRLNLGLSYYF